MTKLLPIILIAMCFAMLSEMRSQKNLSGNGYRRKDAFFCVCMMLVLAVFVGLRTRYNDTTTYTHSYELLRVKDSLFNGIKWSLSSSVGFELTQRLIKYLGGSEVFRFSVAILLPVYCHGVLCVQYGCHHAVYRDLADPDRYGQIDGG